MDGILFICDHHVIPLHWYFFSFQTMFQPDLTKQGRGYQSTYQSSNRPTG